MGSTSSSISSWCECDQMQNKYNLDGNTIGIMGIKTKAEFQQFRQGLKGMLGLKISVIEEVKRRLPILPVLHSALTFRLDDAKSDRDGGHQGIVLVEYEYAGVNIYLSPPCSSSSHSHAAPTTTVDGGDDDAAAASVAAEDNHECRCYKRVYSCMLGCSAKVGYMPCTATKHDLTLEHLLNHIEELVFENGYTGAKYNSLFNNCIHFMNDLGRRCSTMWSNRNDPFKTTGMKFVNL